MHTHSILRDEEINCMNAIADVQSSKDTRNQPIDRVGIRGLCLPVALKTESGVQHTVATIAMSVSLPAHQKGTHMSRFVTLIEGNREPIDCDRLRLLTENMLKNLDAPAGDIEIRAVFFRMKTAPISRIQSMMNYDVTYKGTIENGEYTQTLRVEVPVTSLCPCSKEISDYGAHNQRSCVTVTLCSACQVDPEEVIDLVEQQASCQLYGVLKRPDEKYVTEYAYDHPKFVEDIVRDVAAALREEKRIRCFSVESENFESIHNHSAYAKIISR